MAEDQVFAESTVERIVHDDSNGGIHVDVEMVEKSPKEPSGKVRCATSKVG
jgi:hypothetical protein